MNVPLPPSPPPPRMPSRRSAAGLPVALTATLLTAWCAGSNPLFAQKDDFDRGNDDGWTRVNVLAQYGPLAGGGGEATYTFPETPTGRGIRMQVTSVPPLGDAGTARTYNIRTDATYTDFYAALDIVDWDDTKNQALLIIARGTGFDQVGENCQALLEPNGIPCIPGMLSLNGYVLNYDNQQDGVGDGDRRGGQFQINRIDGELPTTLAAADITIVHGRTYRLVFTGKGATLTGRLYDIEDLTAPLVTIVAEDATYPGGNSGFASYSRDGTIGDSTYDNYHAAATDPDADIAPAIRHPVTGTPQVVVRTPASRFTNFLPPASGLQFTARTFSDAQIDAAATKLFLNGMDVSSALAPLPPNGSTCSFQTAAGLLQPNTTYAARIEVQDATGTRRTTHTFWFDTFSAAYLSASPVKTIEIEDYNHSGGSWLEEPIPVAGYAELQGLEGIDFHDNRTTPEGGWAEYRSADAPGTTEGGREEIEDLVYPADVPPAGRPGDNRRPAYVTAGLNEYQVVRTEAGEWLNYTRTFVATNYHVYLRTGSFGATQARLDRVEGDITVPDQTLTALGTFDIPNHLMRINYRYVPLMKDGQMAVVPLSGRQTVRLTLGGTPVKDNRLLALNYLLFVPVTPSTLRLQSAASVTGPFTTDTAASIQPDSRTITLPRSGEVRFYRLEGASALRITSIAVAADTVTLRYE